MADSTPTPPRLSDDQRDRLPVVRCGSCGKRATTTTILHGVTVPVCLRHLNVWKTPDFDADAAMLAEQCRHVELPDTLWPRLRAAEASASDRLALLRSVASFDAINQTDLPLGLLDAIRAEVGAAR